MTQEEQDLEEGRISRGLREARRRKACLENRRDRMRQSFQVLDTHLMSPEQLTANEGRLVLRQPGLRGGAELLEIELPTVAEVIEWLEAWKATNQEIEDLQRRYDAL